GHVGEELAWVCSEKCLLSETVPCFTREFRRRMRTMANRADTLERRETPMPYHTKVCFENSRFTIVLPLPDINHPFAKRFMRKWSWTTIPSIRAFQLLEKAWLRTSSVGPVNWRTTE